MPRRALVITFIALVSVGLASVYPAFSQAAKADTPLTVEEANEFLEKIEKVLKDTKGEADRASWAKKDAEKLVSRVNDYLWLAATIIGFILLIAGILGGIFVLIRIGQIRVITKEAGELRDQCREDRKSLREIIKEVEEYRNRASEIIQELERSLAKIRGSS